MRDKVEKEVKADFASFKTRIPCISHYAFEKQMQSVYRISKFKQFQQELAAKLYCEVSSYENNGENSKFVVDEDVILEEGKRVSYIVMFDEKIFEVVCNCRLFETQGIICRHVIVVLIRQKVFHILENLF